MKTDTGNFEILFGSNRILHCSHVIEIVGKGLNKQIIRFREGNDGKILFKCEVKDQENHSVVVIDNSKPQHIRQGFISEIGDDSIKIIEKETGLIWLDFTQIGSNNFKLNGIFHMLGFRIIANDEYLEINRINSKGEVIGSNKISECVFDTCSAAIGLG